MKNLYRVLALTLSVLMLLSFAACGGSKNESSQPADSSSQTSEPVSEPESTPESEPVSEPADDGEDESDSDSLFEKYATIQDFIDSDIFQSQWGTISQQMEGSGMSIELKGEGDTLVYLFTYDEFASTDFDDETMALMSDTLYEALLDDSTAETFVSIANSLKAAVDVNKPVVRVTYQTSDGVEIASQDFYAD